jgi:hypothetical protein
VIFRTIDSVQHTALNECFLSLLLTTILEKLFPSLIKLFGVQESSFTACNLSINP